LRSGFHKPERGGIIIRPVNMLQDSVAKLLFRLSLPTTTGMIIYSLFSLIDTFFVAKLGALSFAALTLVIPLQILLISVSSATGVGLTSLIGRTLGSGNVKLADNVAWHGVVISFLYGGLSVGLGLHYIDSLLIIFGSTPETFALSREYIQIVLWGSLFTFLPMTLGNIIQGEGNTFIPMVISLLGISLNVVFDPIFIFGWAGMPALGLNGAAVATVLSQMVTTVVIIALAKRKTSKLTWSRANFRPSLRVVSEIYRVGFPAMVMEVVSVVNLAIINRTLTGYSYTAVAALGIFLRIRSLAYMPVHGLAQGTMPIASFAYGARLFDRVKETIIKSSTLAFVFLGTGWLIMQYQPAWVMQFFSQDPMLTVVGITCMQMATLFLPLMGPLVILYTILQAVGKGFTAMWLSLTRQVVFFLPLLLILPRYYSLNGVWLAFSISEILTASVALIFLISLWRELQVRNKFTVVMLLKGGYLLERLQAWLRWK
jgi:putative MATE family efflux protein